MRSRVLPPWPQARGPREGVIRDHDQHEEQVIVTPERPTRAATAPEDGKAFGHWKSRSFMHEFQDLQVRGIHDVRRIRGRRGIRSRGLIPPQGQAHDAVEIRGHREMPGPERIDYVLIVPSSRRSTETHHDTHCQRREHHATRLPHSGAAGARVGHQRVCAPPRPWPRRPVPASAPTPSRGPEQDG